ncbi:hypothetical protein ABW20_dc0103747 [Dactylellina cionopaga]|nr:hypothetical protein ABW20_dc0103747 [Dactylellina cionopaga]
MRNPSVVSEDGELCSLMMTDALESEIQSSKENDENANNANSGIKVKADGEVSVELTDDNPSILGSKGIKAEAKEKNGLKQERRESTTFNAAPEPTKEKPESKSQNKTDEDEGSTVVKAKGKGGRKRKEESDGKGGDEAKMSKLKRTRKASPSSKTRKKSALSSLQLLTPPPSPPPLNPVEVAELALKSKAEIARKERMKKIPYYREEMKEIFDYLCDRNVYWRNDLPKNKRYSNRDTKLLEKEVRKRIAEILELYPMEKVVMEAFEKEEAQLRVVEEQGEDDAQGEKVTQLRDIQF